MTYFPKTRKDKYFFPKNRHFFSFPAPHPVVRASTGGFSHPLMPPGLFHIKPLRPALSATLCPLPPRYSPTHIRCHCPSPGFTIPVHPTRSLLPCNPLPAPIFCPSPSASRPTPPPSRPAKANVPQYQNIQKPLPQHTVTGVIFSKRGFYPPSFS